MQEFFHGRTNPGRDIRSNIYGPVERPEQERKPQEPPSSTTRRRKATLVAVQRSTNQLLEDTNELIRELQEAYESI